MESYWSQVLTPSCMLVTHSLQSPRHLWLTWKPEKDTQAKSTKKHPSSSGLSQPSKADLQALTTTAGHVLVTPYPYLALCLLLLLQNFSTSLILQLMQKAVGLSHHVPLPSPGRHGATPWASRHPPCSQLLTLTIVALLTSTMAALLTSKLSSAFTIQQSVHVARSSKTVERRARPNAVICKAVLMGLPARAQRCLPPPL